MCRAQSPPDPQFAAEAVPRPPAFPPLARAVSRPLFHSSEQPAQVLAARAQPQVFPPRPPSAAPPPARLALPASDNEPQRTRWPPPVPEFPSNRLSCPLLSPHHPA